jgi:hypothetical protein
MITVANMRFYKVGEYVGRPSVLGNPYYLANEDMREWVIDRYEIWLMEQLKTNEAVRKELKRLKDIYLTTGELTLLCWCAPRKCHAEIIRKAILEWEMSTTLLKGGGL